MNKEARGVFQMKEIFPFSSVYESFFGRLTWIEGMKVKCP